MTHLLLATVSPAQMNIYKNVSVHVHENNAIMTLSVSEWKTSGKVRVAAIKFPNWWLAHTEQPMHTEHIYEQTTQAIGI